MKTLGVLLAEMDAARTRVERPDKEAPHVVPRRPSVRSRRSSWSTRTCGADGQSYEHHAIGAWLERHDASPERTCSWRTAHSAEYHVAERHRRVPRRRTRSRLKFLNVG